MEKEKTIALYRNYITGMLVEILAVFFLMLTAFFLFLLIASGHR